MGGHRLTEEEKAERKAARKAADERFRARARRAREIEEAEKVKKADARKIARAKRVDPYLDPYRTEADYQPQMVEAAWRGTLPLSPEEHRRLNTYRRSHQRVHKRHGRAKEYACVLRVLGEPDIACHGPMSWANLTGNYEDVYDYLPLCAKHHANFDRGQADVLERFLTDHMGIIFP